MLTSLVEHCHLRNGRCTVSIISSLRDYGDTEAEPCASKLSSWMQNLVHALLDGSPLVNPGCNMIDCVAFTSKLTRMCIAYEMRTLANSSDEKDRIFEAAQY